MTDYVINDTWILNRLKSQSNTFEAWIKNLTNSIRKQIKDSPDLRQEVNKHDLRELKQLEQKVSGVDKTLQKVDAELRQMGALGNVLSDFSGQLAKGIDSYVKSNLKLSIGDSDKMLNLDLLQGKRKDLASVLYDVSAEKGVHDGLLYLISSLPDLEAFLYSTSAGKYYRDHTEHTLRVAVLGDFLLDQDLGNGKMKNIIANLTNFDPQKLKDQLWWTTSLLHDIGYPLEKMTYAINHSLVNQILAVYPTLDLEFNPFQIGLSAKGRQKDYLELLEQGLSKQARQLIRKGAGLNPDLSKPKTQIFVKDKKLGHPEYQFKKDIKLDHGVIAALSLLQSLGTPDEIKNNTKLQDYQMVAQAIALHNFDDQLREYVFDNHPLAFFLMFVDELQEWGRPIPIRIKDSYFTMELKKISLLDEITFFLDENQWNMEFQNQQAKDLMGFDFGLFSISKRKALERMDRGRNFNKTEVVLQDIEQQEESVRKAESKKSDLDKILGSLIQETHPVSSKKPTTPNVISEYKITI